MLNYLRHMRSCTCPPSGPGASYTAFPGACDAASRGGAVGVGALGWVLVVPFCCVVLLVLLVGLAFSIDAQVSEVKEPKSATSGGPAGGEELERRTSRSRCSSRRSRTSSQQPNQIEGRLWLWSRSVIGLRGRSERRHRYDSRRVRGVLAERTQRGKRGGMALLTRARRTKGRVTRDAPSRRARCTSCLVAAYCAVEVRAHIRRFSAPPPREKKREPTKTTNPRQAA